MRKQHIVYGTTCALLGAAALVSLLLPESMSIPPASAEPAPPSIIEVGGFLRDFRKSHADFDVSPVNGPGHYANNIKPWLSGTGTPLFDPGGFRVDAQWIDKSGRNIAPAMSGVRGGTGSALTLGVRVNGTIELDGESTIDSFDANRGPYGMNGNYGASAYVATNSIASDAVDVDNRATIFGDLWIGVGGSAGTVVTNENRVTGSIGVLPESTAMPDIAVPTDLTGNQGDVEYSGTTETLTGTIYDPDAEDQPDDPAMLFDGLTLTDAAVLQIEGDLRIVTSTLQIDKNARIEILPEGNLTIYVTGNDDVVLDEAQVNVSVSDADSTRFTINYLGTGDVDVRDASAIYGTIVAANGRLDVDRSDVFGAYIGQHLRLHDHAALHLDLTSSAVADINAALTVHDKIEVKDDSIVDGYDSTLGPYGPGNSGPIALVQTNSTRNDRIKVDDATIDGDVMVGFGGDPSDIIQLNGGGVITGAVGVNASLLPIPTVTAPTMGASAGDVEYSGGAHTISADLRCKHLRIKNGAVVDIVGHVTIRVDDKFQMEDASEITIAPDSSLTMYVNKDAKIEDGSRINMNTGIPRLVSFRRVSLGKKGRVEIKKDAQVCVRVLGRKTELKVKERGEFFGSFIGNKAKIENEGKVHVDIGGLSNCVDVADMPGTVGPFDDGAISSAATFGEWFTNVAGVNSVLPHRIELVQDAMGVWEHIDPSFTPADGLMFGNEGDPHNHHFTFAIKADFTYSDCAGQFVEFKGGDGAWLFVNGALVMDLGGVDSDVLQHVDVDRLGLQDGATCTFELFYADRNTSAPAFHLRTNLELDSSRYLPDMNVMFD